MNLFIALFCGLLMWLVAHFLGTEVALAFLMFEICSHEAHRRWPPK